MTTTLDELGINLRHLRQAAGMSRHDVEHKAKIGFATLRDIELSCADPTLETLRNLARVYGEDITINVLATEQVNR